MPVKVIVDTSNASAQEQQAFLTQHGGVIQSIGASATSHGYAFTYGTGAGEPPAPSQADVYKEMMQSLRYYGGIRYVLLPVYLSAMAVLVGAFFKGDYQVPAPILAGAGLAASAVMLVLEWGLSRNLTLIWAEVDKIVGGGKVFAAASAIDPHPQRSRRLNLVVTRCVFYGIYLAGAAFWGVLLRQVIVAAS